MTMPADDQRASLPGLRVITESSRGEPAERLSSLVYLLVGDRSRVESLSPQAKGYTIERRDLQRRFRVLVAQRTYQEMPLWDLISPKEKDHFLKSAKAWQKRYDKTHTSPTRELHIRFVYEKTADEALFFGFNAHRWLISRRNMHDDKYGENWTEAVTDAWYLDSDQVKLRHPAFSEKLIHQAFCVATSSDERPVIEHVGERPTGLCALSETTTQIHIKRPGGEATDRKAVQVVKITTLAEECLPESLFEVPAGFKKMPLYPNRFTMAHLDLRRNVKHFLRKRWTRA